MNEAKRQAQALQAQYQQEAQAYEALRGVVEAQQKRVYALEAEFAAAEQKLVCYKVCASGRKRAVSAAGNGKNRIQEALAMTEKEIQAGQAAERWMKRRCVPKYSA